MEIIGFVVLFVIMCKVSLACLFVMFNNLGQYNIGGVPNSFAAKMWTVVFMVVVGFLWYKLFQHSPINISLN